METACHKSTLSQYRQGEMEYWSTGVLEYYFLNTSLRYSTTPVFLVDQPSPRWTISSTGFRRTSMSADCPAATALSPLSTALRTSPGSSTFSPYPSKALTIVEYSGQGTI